MIIGRPSKLDEDLINKMYDVIKQGIPIKYACDYLVITQKSFENWMQKGEEDVRQDVYDTIYAKFFLSIKNAQAAYIIDANVDIKSGKPGWQGAAWWLERTRNEFVPKQAIDAGPDGKVTVMIGGKVKDVKTNGIK